MGKLLCQMVIPDSGVGIDLAPRLNLIEDRVLQSLTFDIWNHLATNLTEIPVQHSEHRSFANVLHVAVIARLNLRLAALVHFVGIRANKSFVALYGSTFLAPELKTKDRLSWLRESDEA
jgi:hypothetical protein